ncbi:site-2 protease family protein, partial [Candidatus Saccharibacteria bacterium]|nr:site-2 protease family protein [Candidatus Saccharibacteria bacterium]
MTDFGNPIITITMALLAIAIAITVHEFCHGLVSNLLGDSTAEQSGRLSLNPLAHIDPLTTVALPIILILMKLPPFGAAKPVPINVNKLKYQEFGMAMVSVAGPSSNLLLALFGGLVLRIFGTLNSSLWVNWWVLFVSINIAFFIF